MSTKQTDLHPSVETVLPYAVRYAMGRKSYAVVEVVDALLDVWDLLHETTHGQIRRDLINRLSREVRYNNIHAANKEEPKSLFGHMCDRSTWMRLFGKVPECHMSVRPGTVGFCDQDILGVVVDSSESIVGYRFVDGDDWAPKEVTAVVGACSPPPAPGSQWTPEYV